MLSALLTFLFLWSSALASPLGWESFMLEERGAGASYYTNVSMSPQKVSFGSVTPEDAVTSAMGCACPAGTAICDTSTSQSCLIVQTQIYRDKIQTPENAALVFAPGSNTDAVQGLSCWNSKFHIHVGPLYVKALAGVAAAAKQCQTETWINEGETRSGEDGTNTAIFCSLSQEILIQRLDMTGAPVDQMSLSVTMELEPAIAFQWCDITGILGAIAGVFSGGAALAAAFGVGSLVCNDAGGSV